MEILNFPVLIVHKLAVSDLRLRGQLGPARAALLVNCDVADDETQFVDANLSEAAQRSATERMEPTAHNCELRHYACPHGSISARRRELLTCRRDSISIARSIS